MKIGLVGVPLESVPVQDAGINMEIYYPGITDETRRSIISAAKGVQIEDLGELCLGEHYSVGFRIDRLQGIHDSMVNCLRTRDMAALERERIRFLAESLDFDHLVAVGPSHLGAIVLYEDGDKVARLDYHDDFSGLDPKKVFFSYASYLDWVKDRIKDVQVYNYFVHERQAGRVFGKECAPEETDYVTADHFDTDVDCIDRSHLVQRSYPHTNGQTNVSPKRIVTMIREARPRKLGFWEYRPRYDYEFNGLYMIANAVRALSSGSQR